MATTFSSQLQPSNSTDALFRAWAQFIHDALSAGGWEQTADTGQINLATVTKPGAANTMQGYEVWRMADSLQGSFPVYLKVSYGSGNGAANEPGIDLSLGTGSNGSGTVTGLFLTTMRVDNQSNGTGIAAMYSHSSGSTSHIAVSLFVNVTGAYLVSFSIERARDSTGAEVGTHLVVISSEQAATIRNSRYLIRAGGTQPTAQTSLTSVVTGSIVSGSAHTEYASQQDVGFGLILPISGTSAVAMRPESAALGYIVTPDTFTTTDAVLVVYIYGVPRVYKRMSSNRPGINGNTTVNSHVAWQRYE